jgi:TolB-like protein/tetratricopeptide (TPR) repeat protein
MSRAPDRRVFEFGGFTLDAAEHRLAGPDGASHRLTPKPMAMLVYMAERPDRLLTKQELMDAVWPDVVVEENSLNQTISALRRLLGDSGRVRRFITTVPGLGYRFAGPVGLRGEDDVAETDEPGAPSIAVLPFEDLSRDRDQAHFADGVAEETLNRFAGISGLRTIGRTSSFLFRGRQERTQLIGAELGARYLVTGAVRKEGARVRVSAQLIEARSGAQTWAQTFDRELEDVFAIEDEIASSVASAVRHTIAETVPQSGATRDPEAYDLYLRARAAVRRTGAEAMVRAIELYREALSLDPGYALAWAGLAEACRGALIFAPHAVDARALLQEAATRAVALAPNFWGSHVARAWQHFVEYDWAGFSRELDEAERLAPGRPSELSYHRGTFLAQVGRPRDALEHFRRASRADPLSLLYSSSVQFASLYAGRPEEAEAEYRRSLDLPGSRDLCELAALHGAWLRGDPQWIAAQFRRYLDHRTIQAPALEQVYEVRDRPEEALALLRGAVSHPNAQSATVQQFLAWWLARYGDADAALAAARRGLLASSSGVVSWLWVPVLAEMRRAPAFKDLLRELGLVDYWRATGNWGDVARPRGDDDFECL